MQSIQKLLVGQGTLSDEIYVDKIWPEMANEIYASLNMLSRESWHFHKRLLLQKSISDDAGIERLLASLYLNSFLLLTAPSEVLTRWQEVFEKIIRTSRISIQSRALAYVFLLQCMHQNREKLSPVNLERYCREARVVLGMLEHVKPALANALDAYQAKVTGKKQHYQHCLNKYEHMAMTMMHQSLSLDEISIITKTFITSHQARMNQISAYCQILFERKAGQSLNPASVLPLISALLRLPSTAKQTAKTGRILQKGLKPLLQLAGFDLFRKKDVQLQASALMSLILIYSGDSWVPLFDLMQPENLDSLLRGTRAGNPAEECITLAICQFLKAPESDITVQKLKAIPYKILMNHRELISETLLTTALEHGFSKVLPKDILDLFRTTIFPVLLISKDEGTLATCLGTACAKLPKETKIDLIHNLFKIEYFALYSDSKVVNFVVALISTLPPASQIEQIQSLIYPLLTEPEMESIGLIVLCRLLEDSICSETLFVQNMIPFIKDSPLIILLRQEPERCKDLLDQLLHHPQKLDSQNLVFAGIVAILLGMQDKKLINNSLEILLNSERNFILSPEEQERYGATWLGGYLKNFYLINDHIPGLILFLSSSMDMETRKSLWRALSKSLSTENFESAALSILLQTFSPEDQQDQIEGLIYNLEQIASFFKEAKETNTDYPPKLLELLEKNLMQIFEILGGYFRLQPTKTGTKAFANFMDLCFKYEIEHILLNLLPMAPLEYRLRGLRNLAWSRWNLSKLINLTSTLPFEHFQEGIEVLDRLLGDDAYYKHDSWTHFLEKTTNVQLKLLILQYLYQQDPKFFLIVARPILQSIGAGKVLNEIISMVLTCTGKEENSNTAIQTLASIKNNARLASLCFTEIDTLSRAEAILCMPLLTRMLPHLSEAELQHLVINPKSVHSLTSSDALPIPKSGSLLAFSIESLIEIGQHQDPLVRHHGAQQYLSLHVLLATSTELLLELKKKLFENQKELRFMQQSFRQEIIAIIDAKLRQLKIQTSSTSDNCDSSTSEVLKALRQAQKPHASRLFLRDNGSEESDTSTLSSFRGSTEEDSDTSHDIFWHQKLIRMLTKYIKNRDNNVDEQTGFWIFRAGYTKTEKKEAATAAIALLQGNGSNFNKQKFLPILRDGILGKTIRDYLKTCKPEDITRVSDLIEFLISKNRLMFSASDDEHIELDTGYFTNGK